MISNYYDNLQYVFACLSTHSNWIDKISNNFKEIKKYFILSPCDEMELRNFFDTQKNKILTASLIMEEKRWREVLVTLKYVPILIKNKCLKVYWGKYLRSFDLIHHIPKTPILESIEFLYFLSSHNFDNPLIDQVIEYELTRNKVLSYDFSVIKNFKNDNLDVIKFNFEKYRVDLNQSLVKKNFNCSIANVINFLQKGISPNLYDVGFGALNEDLIFFKNRETGLVKSISLNKSGNNLLDGLIQSPNILNWMKSLKNKLNPNAAYEFIRNMHKNDVISIFSTS